MFNKKGRPEMKTVLLNLNPKERFSDVYQTNTILSEDILSHHSDKKGALSMSSVNERGSFWLIHSREKTRSLMLFLWKKLIKIYSVAFYFIYFFFQVAS